MKLTPDDALSQRRIAGIGYDGFSEEASQPVAAGLKPFAGELSARWKRKKAQAKEAGFKAKHVGYTPTASAEPATPLLDRLSAGNGPVRIIVKDGVRIVD